MRHLQITVPVWILLLASSATPCRSGMLPERLSLADAVAIALGANANLEQAEENYRTSLSRLRIAGFSTTYSIGSMAEMERSTDQSGFSTRVAGSMGYQNTWGTQAALDLSPFGYGSRRGSVGVSLRHPLMQGKGVLSDKSDLMLSAGSDATIQSKSLYLSRQATVLGVIEAYQRAVLARERVKIQERAVAIAEEAAESARKRADAGLVAEIEVSRAEIRVAQTRDQLNQQRQSARGALERLTLAIGTGVGEAPALTEGIPEQITEVPELGESVTVALANRSELDIQDERISTQQRRLAMTEDRLRPRLDVVAGFDSTRREAGVISGSLFDLGSLTTGFELRFPIDKRISHEERDSAERNLDVLRKLRVYRMEEIAEQVRGAHRGVESARASLEILSQNLKVAEDNLRLAQRMVEEGLVSNRDVLEAQESLTQVESGLLSARMDLYLANINLKYAMGEDLATILL